MDFADVVRSRRMVRAFESRPVPADVLDRVLDLARRVPAAGNTQGLDLVVLEGPAQTARYWDATLPPERREAFPWPRLLDAPVLIVPVGDPDAYVERYAEPDKARTGLGRGRRRLVGAVLVRRHRVRRDAGRCWPPSTRGSARCSSGSSSTRRR